MHELCCKYGSSVFMMADLVRDGITGADMDSLVVDAVGVDVRTSCSGSQHGYADTNVLCNLYTLVFRSCECCPQDTMVLDGKGWQGLLENRATTCNRDNLVSWHCEPALNRRDEAPR